MNVKKINLYLIRFSLSAFLLFLNYELYSTFGQISWIIFIVIMFSRPLSDIFPKFKLFKKIVLIRQGLGVICGNYAIAHVVGYFLHFNINPLNIIFDGYSWNPTNRLGSGMLAFVFLLIPRLTSNKSSIKLLTGKWRKIQYFAYPAFFLTGIHIALVMDKIEPYIILTLYSIIYFLAFKKRRGTKTNQFI